MSGVLKDKNRAIKFIITFLIPFLIFLIPTTELFTFEMKVFIVFTIGMLLWAATELTDLYVPAILWPILMIVFKILPADVVYSSYLSTVIFACIAGIILGATLDRVGILKRLSYWIIIKCGGSFERTIFALFIASSVMSILTFMGAALIIAAMCYGLCKAMKVKARSSEGAIIMMTGMLAASTIRMFIYCPAHVGLLVGSINGIDPNFTITVFDLLKYNWPVLVYCCLFIFLMLKANKKNIAVDGHGLEYFKQELSEMGAMSIEEKKAAVIIALTMAAILTSQFHGIDGMQIIIMATVLLFFPGIDVGKVQDTQKVSIGMILFIGSCMAIGSGCSTLGITAILSNMIAPMIAGFSSLGVLVAILLFGIVMNLPMTPLAMLAALSGPLFAIGSAAGANPLAIAFTFLFSTDMVFLPFQYVIFLIFFSFGMMSTMQFFKYHAWKNLLFLLFYLIVLVPYWKLLGLF